MTDASTPGPTRSEASRSAPAMGGGSVGMIVGGDRGPQVGTGRRPDDDLLEGLNPPQREAVTYPGPALLIVADAGSGKPRVLTPRIASLLRPLEAWPSELLAPTFTTQPAGYFRAPPPHQNGTEPG